MAVDGAGAYGVPPTRRGVQRGPFLLLSVRYTVQPRGIGGFKYEASADDGLELQQAIAAGYRVVGVTPGPAQKVGGFGEVLTFTYHLVAT